MRSSADVTVGEDDVGANSGISCSELGAGEVERGGAVAPGAKTMSDGLEARDGTAGGRSRPATEPVERSGTGGGVELTVGMDACRRYCGARATGGVERA